jgi:hypothetical protein
LKLKEVEPAPWPNLEATLAGNGARKLIDQAESRTLSDGRDA